MRAGQELSFEFAKLGQGTYLGDAEDGQSANASGSHSAGGGPDAFDHSLVVLPLGCHCCEFEVNAASLPVQYRVSGPANQQHRFGIGLQVGRGSVVGQADPDVVVVAHESRANNCGIGSAVGAGSAEGGDPVGGIDQFGKVEMIHKANLRVRVFFCCWADRLLDCLLCPFSIMKCKVFGLKTRN